MRGRQHIAVTILFVATAILVAATIVILGTSPFLLAAVSGTSKNSSEFMVMENNSNAVKNGSGNQDGNNVIPTKTPDHGLESNTTQIQSIGQNFTCSKGWYITGYFNPRETDYSGRLKPVNVTGVGIVMLNTKFMRHVNIEGMGYTRFGWVIAGQHAGNYTKVPFPEDSMNPPGRLRVGYSIATDRSVIPALTYVTIPTLPAPFNEYKYRSVDIGVFASGKPDIKGKHIDVFAGDGLEGQSWAQKVTSRNNTVCIY
jgi:3D (Asp-Asp-Asp) domain-containing protein